MGHLISTPQIQFNVFTAYPSRKSKQVKVKWGILELLLEGNRGRMMKVVMRFRPNELWRSPRICDHYTNRYIDSCEAMQRWPSRPVTPAPRQCGIFRILTSSFFDTSIGRTLNVFFMTTGCLVCLTSWNTDGFVLIFLLHSTPQLIRQIHSECTHTHTHTIISTF